MKRRHDPLRLITGSIYLSVAILAVVFLVKGVREDGVFWGAIVPAATLLFLVIGMVLSDRELRDLVGKAQREWRARR